MKNQEYKANQTVTLADTDATALVVEYNKGWYTVIVNDEQRKVRAKSIIGVIGGETSGNRTLASQIKKYVGGYEPAISYSGNHSKSCGDDISHLFEGATPIQVMSVAEKVCGLETGELIAKYAKMNPGQARMCAGNRIRAAIKRGDITYDDVVKAL